MLYEILSALTEQFSFFNVTKYITFRSMIAMLTALFISFMLSPWFIRKLQKKQIGQVIRNDGPESHLSKSGTPTMGGGLILLAILLPTLMWMDISNHFLWYAVIVTASYGILGFVDDYLKVHKKNTKGVSGKMKLAFQFLISGAVCFYHFYIIGDDFLLTIPFVKDYSIDLGVFYIPFAMLVIVGSSNAVNLTDGLDGLAIGPVMIAAGCFAILTYVTGNSAISEYLHYHYIPGTGELTVFALTLVGAGLGFLWYNTYPAQVFMGDVGSLPLGGALGVLAVFSKHEILLVIIGGIFVVEAVSVMAQVGSFKLTGKRVFKMAPIHHHFELKGWPEPKVIVRFWIIAIILAMIGLLNLKLR